MASSNSGSTGSRSHSPMTTPMAAICCCGSTPAGTAAPLRVDVRSLSKALAEVERVLAVY